MALDDSISKSLIHFDGSDGATSLTDESGKTWTFSGTAQLDTEIKKFGSASLLIPSAGDYIYAADHADWHLGSGDFTIEAWVRRAAKDVQHRVLGRGSGFGANLEYWIGWNATNLATIVVGDGTTTYSANHTTAVTDTDTLHHLAGIRSGNNMYIALDGVLSAARDLTGITVQNLNGIFSIGRQGSYATGPFVGSLDEFRLSKSARWTENFTPPDAPYGPISRLKEIANLSDFAMI